MKYVTYLLNNFSTRKKKQSLIIYTFSKSDKLEFEYNQEKKLQNQYLTKSDKDFIYEKLILKYMFITKVSINIINFILNKMA